jgi:Putative Ig domain
MVRSNWRNVVMAAVAGLMLAACGEDGLDTTATNSPSAPSQSAPNVVPTLSGSPSSSVTAGTTYLFQPVATDGDGDMLSFSVAGMPAWATLNPQTGVLSGTPGESDVGTTADIILSVSDGEASVSLPAFRIAIASAQPPSGTPTPPSNGAPVISGTPAMTATATQTYSFTPSATDPDGQTLAFSVVNLPAWASFSARTGRLSGTPSTTQVRTYSGIVITVTDGSLSGSLPSFSITVNAPANRAPSISGSPASSVTAGAAYSFTPTASDPDGQTLSYSIANKPSWATFSTSSGRLSGTSAGTNVGTTSGIVITVSDGALTASLSPFSVTVNAATNAAPVISGTPATSIAAGSAYSFTPSASDADGNTLAFSISGKPTWATFSTATGALTGSPNAAQVGAYGGIVISVSDGTASTSLTSFSITVSAPPTGTGTATLSWSAPTQNTDGSSLTDLAGYRVYHGMNANSLTDMVQVPGAAAGSYTFTQLASGTHYFAVSAYTNSGAESTMSAVGSKTIP